VSIDPSALPDDVDALKRIISELARDAVAARAEIVFRRAKLTPELGDRRAKLTP
jgi:hypothetical protein